jgi:MFS family permease
MVAFLNAADRSILVAVMPKLRDEFGLTPERLALINSVFFWIYAFAAFLSGRLGDSTRRSWVIVGGLAFWSVATGLVSLATGFTMLLALRGMVALGEATYYPTGTALISDWHRPAMRSRALSIHQTAVLAGTGFGAYAAGLIADRLGWQAPFVIFAAAGVVWCGVLFKALQDAPSRAVRDTGDVRKSLLGPMRVVVRRPPALFLCSVFSSAPVRRPAFQCGRQRTCTMRWVSISPTPHCTGPRRSASPGSSPSPSGDCSPIGWRRARRSAGSIRWRSAWGWQAFCCCR